MAEEVPIDLFKQSGFSESAIPAGPPASAPGSVTSSSSGYQLPAEPNEGIAMFRNRAIGFIIADVTVEEVERHDLEITRHPVERGANITDHAFRHPPEVIIRCGWSSSGLMPGYVEQVYDQLLTLQATRQPFTVVTGKRFFTNMLIQSVSSTTDHKTENALLCTVVCRQIIIVQTSTTSVAPREQQAGPQATGATEQAGARQPTNYVTGDTLTASRGPTWGGAAP